jgi:hypothetical protein
VKLEKWPWISAIIAIPVGILVWLVDRNDAITFCKDWGKTIIRFKFLIIPSDTFSRPFELADRHE